ncbi:MAG TPA: hypothetical protein VKA86_09105 [Candidatus Krumholzibacteria bacterium]|nr:hypothetical protein [Candidatus Krumholzibacteria bacterium]
MRQRTLFCSFALGVVTGAACLVPLPSSAQTDSDLKFATDKRVVSIGNVGLAFATRGFIGEMFGSGQSSRPSFEFPLNSGVEHLWSAGLWVGAIDGFTRQPLVSAGVVDATLDAGSSSPSGFEFSPQTVRVEGGDDDQVIEDPLAALLISRNPLQQNFRLDALADEHFILRYNDTSASGGDESGITNPHVPMGLEVRCDILGYASRFADSFVIMLFEVTNVGDRFLENVHLGWYIEPIVVNRGKLEFPASGGDLFFGDIQGYLGPERIAQETASEFFDPGLLEADPSARVVYRIDADGDGGDATSWSGVRYLGSDAPDGAYFNYRQWQYSSTGGIPNEAEYGDPARYAYMRGCEPERPLEDLLADLSEGCGEQVVDAGPGEGQGSTNFTSEGNWVGMFSIGPWPALNPGESANFAIAMVAGADADEMLNNSSIAQFSFDNGFTLPSGPPSPNLNAVARGNAVELRWDPGERPEPGAYDPATASPEFHRSVLTNEPDFQGYRIYRIDGDVVTEDPFEQAALIAEFDIDTNVDGTSDDRGFNTGLPPLVDGQRVFVDRNVLNGFPYRYAVTSYSAPDPRAGLPELESGFNENSVVVVPGSGPTGTNPDLDASERDAVSVYPNPYRAASLYDNRFPSGEPRELGRSIFFANVPPRANIDVYNLAGTRIVQLQNRSVDDTLVEWNVMSEETRAIAPGLYVYAVENLETGDIQRGKLVILK